MLGLPQIRQMDTFHSDNHPYHWAGYQNSVPFVLLVLIWHAQDICTESSGIYSIYGKPLEKPDYEQMLYESRIKVNRAKLLSLTCHTKGTGSWYPAQC